MAIELEVRVNKERPWMIDIIAHKVEVAANFDTKTGKVHFWGNRSIEDWEEILSKMKELQGNATTLYEDNLPDDYEVN